MNTDELKPLWRAYRERIGAESQWHEEELLELVKTVTPADPWYKMHRHALLNFCVSCLLLGITSGC